MTNRAQSGILGIAYAARGRDRAHSLQWAVGGATYGMVRIHLLTIGSQTMNNSENCAQRIG